MAGKKRAKKRNPTKKRAHAKRAHKKRAAAPPAHRRRRAKRANPKRAHARRTRRATRANPRRRRRHAKNPKRAHARRRRHVANPARRRRRHHFSKRAHRRNPGIPAWAIAGLAAALGLVSYAVANDGSFALTQRLDPTLGTLQRNRYIVSGILTAAGLALAAFVSPVLGAGLAAGGLASLAGTQLSLLLGKAIDKKNPDGSLQTAQPAAAPAVTAAPTVKGLGSVYEPGGQVQHLAGVFGPGGNQQFGAVYDSGGQLFGNISDLGQGGGSYFAG